MRFPEIMNIYNTYQNQLREVNVKCPSNESIQIKTGMFLSFYKFSSIKHLFVHIPNYIKKIND